MEWLGVKHDGDIVRQSLNKARHQEVSRHSARSGVPQLQSL